MAVDDVVVSFRIENVDKPNIDLEFFLEEGFCGTKVHLGLGVSVDIVGMPPGRIIEQE